MRLYQYGDEVRAIDWAVSSKGHGTFVKTYKEEQEQQVLVLLDVSASQRRGRRPARRKLDVGRDIAGLLALSRRPPGLAAGPAGFFRPEGAVPAAGQRPAGGLRPAFSGCLTLVPASRRTAWGRASGRRWGCCKRRSLVLLISDFHRRGLRARADHAGPAATT
ncbi:MAG: DUF58 domain-containing protein [Hymenobacter sp.]